MFYKMRVICMLCVQNLIMIGDQQANKFACSAFEILQNHKWTFIELFKI